MVNRTDIPHLYASYKQGHHVRKKDNLPRQQKDGIATYIVNELPSTA